MGDEQNTSILVRFLSVAFFLVLALAALAWFIVSVSELVSDLLFGRSVVSFDKGAIYMLGAGLAGLLFAIGGVMQGLLRKNLTPKIEVLFTKALMFSLILMFGFPHVAHYVVASYTQQKNYRLCSDATYQWLLYSKLYYTSSSEACNELVKEKEITKSSSRR